MEPPRVRVGPRERLTVTATVREVDGWRVAARIAGRPLAEWAVEALNRAAVAAVGGRVEKDDGPEPASGEAQYATEKVLDFGGKPISLSDSNGF